jgi:hypothetical protein
MIININNADYDIHDRQSAEEMLTDIGINKLDIVDIFNCLGYESDDWFEADGMVGDDFYSFCDGVSNDIDELDDVAAALLDRSKKGNTRADLSNRLKTIIGNLRLKLTYNEVYEVKKY